MKSKLIISVLLIAYIMNTAFQCNKCQTNNLYLDATRSWLPLKGKTQLVFTDNTGTIMNFNLHVIDTIEVAVEPGCNSSYKYEYIKTSLYLNPGMSDSIYFSLASGGWLCMQAVSSNVPNMSMCNVFGQTREGTVAKRLSDQPVGKRTYKEVILLLHNPGVSGNIDSVFIANNTGIAGFNYANRTYTLQ